MKRSFFIRTYGCQMNERDSEALACLLEENGYRRADSEAGADILLFNTCSVRDQAERKVVGKVGLLRKVKEANPGMVIGILGCMAQNHADALLKKLPHVDLIVGTDRIHMLPELLQEVLDGRRGLVRTEPGQDVLSALTGHCPGRVTAFVSVMRGCNEFCSYCIVPYVRGREKSRPVEEIVAEVAGLAETGTKEVCLLGQNITAYGLAELRGQGPVPRDISPFADLLRAVHSVPGIARIRFTSPHPKTMNQDFVDAVCSLPKVCKAFHIPLQSGSDRILHLMKRGYTVAEYLARIEAIRARLSDVCFSTDVIVGFPGETEDDFAATRTAMAAVGYDMAYIFKYSPRAGTSAHARLRDDVPQAVKEERNQVLLADLERRVAQANKSYVGRTVEVLLEGPSKRNSKRWAGRSDTNKVCIVEPRPGLHPGDLTQIRITRATAHALFGELCAPPVPPRAARVGAELQTKGS
jgi:tRNA-2-methylthio-N6-dimethylallyladenosine synthase